MTDAELAAYVQSMSAKGKSRAEIREKLLRVGWDPATVDDALGPTGSADRAGSGDDTVTSSPSSVSGFSGTQASSANILERYATLFLQPEEFFESISSVTTYEIPLKEVVGFAMAFALVNFIFSLLSNARGAAAAAGPLSAAASPALTLAALPFTLIFSALFVVAGLFIVAGVYHVGVWLVGGRAGYYATFKPTAYSLLISLAYNGVLAVALIFIGFVEPPVNTASIGWMNALTYQTHPITLGVSTLIGLMSLIHTIYALTAGIARCHGLPRARAFTGVMVPIAIIVVLIVVVAFLAVSLIGGMAVPGIPHIQGAFLRPL